MLDANNYTFLIEFENSFNGSFIVNNSINNLRELVKTIEERGENSKKFKVYTFDKTKRKFTKITLERFKILTKFCTELDVLLNK